MRRDRVEPLASAGAPEYDRRAVLVALFGISASLALVARRGNVCTVDPAMIGRASFAGRASGQGELPQSAQPSETSKTTAAISRNR